MSSSPASSRQRWNASRWPTGHGHYESWFVRANHPTRPLALWLRYTIYAPAADPARAEGELWAVWFDGERRQIVAVKSEHPIADCHFDRDRLAVDIAGSTLDDEALVGTCEGGGHEFTWSLAMEGGGRPLLLLSPGSYDRRFPKAKVLVARPSCRLRGRMTVDGERMDIDGWLGSQNHNWGSAHTDRYAWGQVAGFDGRDDVFLECSSARVRVGPLLTPWLTLAVLRLGEEEIDFNNLGRSAFAHVELGGSRWSFRTSNGRDRLRVTMSADPGAFVDLAYRNPPGDIKICRNSKIATCELRLERPGEPPLELRASQRAAFELLGLADATSATSTTTRVAP